MNLIIQEQELKPIQTNLAEIRAHVETITAKFANVVYDETQMKVAKSDRAELRHIKDDIENRRKQLKAKWNAPYLAVEAEIKEITAEIDKPVMLIDGQIKEYEARLQEERKNALKAHFEKFNALGNIIKFERVIEGEKWLNLSMREEKAKLELSEKMEGISNEISTLETIIEAEFRTACLAEYAETLDTNMAIAKQVRLKAAKAEQEKILGAAAEEPKPVEKDNITEFAPTEEDIFAEPATALQVSTRRFAITATDDKFVALRQFCANNGIKLREVF